MWPTNRRDAADAEDALQAATAKKKKKLQEIQECRDLPRMRTDSQNPPATLDLPLITPSIPAGIPKLLGKSDLLNNFGEE